jgi:molybdopterin-guanine dinucleotide biosynthesis protein A
MEPENKFSNLLGIVMCGGRSIRMGRDKGLIEKGGQTWAEIAFYNLSALHIPVYVSLNELQVPLYKKIFSLNNLVVDNNDLNGPLKGLMSAHREFPQKDLLILASDMIDMDSSILEELRTSYCKNKDYDFYVFKDETEIEPLCGIYKANALDKIWKNHQSKHLPKHSMKYVLSTGTFLALPLTLEKKAFFTNYNEPF